MNFFKKLTFLVALVIISSSCGCFKRQPAAVVAPSVAPSVVAAVPVSENTKFDDNFSVDDTVWLSKLDDGTKSFLVFRNSGRMVERVVVDRDNKTTHKGRYDYQDGELLITSDEGVTTKVVVADGGFVYNGNKYTFKKKVNKKK